MSLTSLPMSNERTLSVDMNNVEKVFDYLQRLHLISKNKYSGYHSIYNPCKLSVPTLTSLDDPRTTMNDIHETQSECNEDCDSNCSRESQIDCIANDENCIELDNASDHDESHASSIHIHIPRKLGAAILGLKGETLRRLRRASGARISVSSRSQLPNGDHGTEIQIYGEKEHVERAVQLIQNVLVN